MKIRKTHIIALAFLVWLLLDHATVFSQESFTRGVNLTGWFQTSSASQIQFTKYTRKDFQNIQKLGCDVIRLPIDMTAMSNGSPDYIIDSLFYFFLDSAVTWAEDLKINLILDNHTMDPGTNTASNIGTMLQKIWLQMAEHYKDRSRYILYELRNEPHGISTSAWANIEKSLITSIRTVDTVHTIIVGSSGWNTYSELKYLPVFSDTNLIYTFHFYDPFLFTHQGATWPSPSMGSLGGVPFPYDSARMPACPADLKGTWVEGSLATSYKTDGTVAKVKQLIDVAAAFKESRKVKVYCGEFGVYDLNSDTADRVFWYETVRNYLEEKGLSWTIWDYHGGFGIFKKGSGGLFDYDLNIPMLEALGLTPPEQKTWVPVTDSSGINIYTDFIGTDIFESSSVGGGTLNFYCTENTRVGKYCIKFSGVNQYSNTGFDFNPNRDLSYLKSQKYFLEFFVKGDTTNLKFDVRFIDTKTGPDDHPWRIRRTIDKSIAPMDGKWHYVKLALTSFTEHGSWDNNAWYNPVGLFDWKAIDRLEFVAEEMALTGHSLWFDQISLTDTTVDYPSKSVSYTSLPGSLKIYPNPVNPSSQLKYTIPHPGEVEISIFSLTGKKLYVYKMSSQVPGEYSLPLPGFSNSGRSLSHGIYFCRITAVDFVRTIKFIVTDTCE